MKFKSNEMGRCPFCNDYNLEYGSVEFDSNMQYFPWKCKSCGRTGEEWYTMEFSGHNIINDNGENIEIWYNMVEEE